jgi:hypothetical protein
MQNNSDISRFLSELNIKKELNIEEDLGNGYVKLKVSEAERRQALQDINCVEDIIIELLRNSRDANCKNVFIGTKKIEDKRRILYFIDDGMGIPPKFHNIIFESRVTSKLDDGKKDDYGFHGRGMALFSIKLNIDEIKVTYSNTARGTSIYLNIDLENITEKRDQSLLPEIKKVNGKFEIIGGVNNIIKTILEFKLRNGDINFYYGTPTQIISTIRNKAINENKSNKLPVFDRWDDFYRYINNNEVKLIEFLSLTNNYNLLEEISKKIFNMDLSQRNIQRIIYNEINTLNPIDLNLTDVYNKEYLSIAGLNSKYNSNKNNKGRIKLYDELGLSSRFKDEEIKAIVDLVEEEVLKLGSKYFITLKNKVEFKRDDNVIKLIIELKQKD